MSKSEQVGEIHQVELNEINEKLRTIQRLFDGIFEFFGEKYLSQFLTTAQHNVLAHTLGEVVPHDSLINLSDVAILNDTLTDNESKILKIRNDATVVEAVEDPQAVDINEYVFGTTDQITVTDSNDGTITLSTPQDIATDSTPSFAGLTSTGNMVFSGAGKIA